MSDFYSNANLIARASGNACRGPIAEMNILLPIPADMRSAIVGEAHTRGNYQGGRWSDNLRAAVAQWERNGSFPFGARAKAHREAENARNEGNLGPRIILPMN